MSTSRELRVLTINSGSSSIKVALYQMGAVETRVLLANVERIGSPASRMYIVDAFGRTLLDRQGEISDHNGALVAVLEWTKKQDSTVNLDGVGHRVVLGDSRCIQPQRITQEVIATLQELTPVAPDHLPQMLDGIAAVTRVYRNVPQVACFDSEFHRQMPLVARMYALPRRFYDAGVRRYGFHGLSCEYIMQAVRILDPTAANGRVIIAHLGNGASMTAVNRGTTVDTSMGFTPLSGLAMGTRCGDLDPGALLYLLQEDGMTSTALNELLNKRSGLLGVSEYSADMRDLLNREFTDPRCAEAIAIFCYQARKVLGAYTAVLGGLDTLIFTGGIGENAAPIRERICTGMDFIGITLDSARNAVHAPVISAKNSTVTVRIIKTDEDLMIARHTRRVVAQEGENDA